jgi:dTDP-glucose pyrophosphorylase
MGNSSIVVGDEEYPLYLMEIKGKLLLEQEIAYCRAMNPRKFLFCVMENDIQSARVDSVIRQLVPDSEIISLNGATKGAVCTALLAARHIDNDEELILLSIDDFLEEGGKNALEYFREGRADAGIVSFTSVHPRYAFARVDDTGSVIEVATKRPISKHALISFYYFRQGSDFVECAKETIRKDNPVNGTFYISQTLNEMILRRKKVACFTVENDKFHPLKTEKQLAQYIMEMQERGADK